MMFHHTRIKDDYQTIIIDGNPINYTKKQNFLGVIIDHELNWSDHILYIKNNISKSIGINNKTWNLLEKNTLRNLYFTFIYPYLIYCIEICGNTNDTHLNQIIKIFNLLVIIHRLMSERQLFTFKIASNGLHLNEIYS